MPFFYIKVYNTRIERSTLGGSELQNARNKKIGMLGGTFNPIHTAHVDMGRLVREEFDLDEVLFIPAGDPPHKAVEGAVCAAHRARMTQLALRGLPGLSMSDIELDRAGKSYTIDTVAALSALYPGAAIYIVVGSDMLRDLPHWHRARELLQKAAFIGVPRQGRDHNDAEALSLLAQYGARVPLSKSKAPPISSTMVRAGIYKAQPITGFTPPAVERYIYLHMLYQPPDISAIAKRLRGMLSPSRYAHTAGVVQEAIALAARYGVCADAARLAALLHDCGRSRDIGALTHAQAGAAVARDMFGVSDEAVLSAIRRHTTLGAGATKLDKIICLADMLEPGRDYEGVEALRAAAETSLDDALRRALLHTVAYVKSTGGEVDEGSLLALRELS
ncbi:MAG: nicotinate-nucleotide adenylyltransferase [Clostridiales bacterium]|jgi:nicotinate-nucleotide adenylyltransferase|nr:nicotinate-nucleotide adenylyltransferase [Clostridiales bacterium]